MKIHFSQFCSSTLSKQQSPSANWSSPSSVLPLSLSSNHPSANWSSSHCRWFAWILPLISSHFSQKNAQLRHEDVFVSANLAALQPTDVASPEASRCLPVCVGSPKFHHLEVCTDSFLSELVLVSIAIFHDPAHSSQHSIIRSSILLASQEVAGITARVRAAACLLTSLLPKTMMTRAPF